jgi:dodecin
MAIAKIIEITSRSDTSFDDAVDHGLTKVGETVHNIQSAWVKDMQVHVTDGRPSSYQVTLKITFVVD